MAYRSGDAGKLFIGGISWETTTGKDTKSSPSFSIVPAACNTIFAEKLIEYYKQFGEVVDGIIMKDKMTDRPRGFGFITYASFAVDTADSSVAGRYADPDTAQRVAGEKHTLDGRTVDRHDVFLLHLYV